MECFDLPFVFTCHPNFFSPGNPIRSLQDVMSKKVDFSTSFGSSKFKQDGSKA